MVEEGAFNIACNKQQPGEHFLGGNAEGLGEEEGGWETMAHVGLSLPQTWKHMRGRQACLA